MKFFLGPDHYIDTSEPIDISLEMSDTAQNVIAWYADAPEMEPVRANGYIGSVKEGGAVNFRNIFFNPHAHGTHTECLGHITEEIFSINKTIKDYFFRAKLISVEPEKKSAKKNQTDFMITKKSIQSQLLNCKCEALVIRTLPNLDNKLSMNYSSTNPPYMDLDCIELLNEIGVKHLLIDLPSVDREDDKGILAFHHAFWQVPENPRHDRTITELIFVPTSIKDGDYILELQLASFANDAVPSRPVLYKQKKG